MRIGKRIRSPRRMRAGRLAALFLIWIPCSLTAAEISGELKVWHKVTLTFEGPETSEMANPNPFLYYRLEVIFSHAASERSFRVPGYFAADGDAAESSAGRGSKWRVHFAPDAEGEWHYEVSFRMGRFAAVRDRPDSGVSAGFMDGEKGIFEIAPSDKTGRDFRGKGMLKHVGKRHLRFSGTGEYFLKCGADAPENFLACADFDGDFKTDGHGDQYIKTWAAHVQDWREEDPTWQEGRGKGVIGALNYLAAKGMNAFSFLTLNIQGDDRNVFPYVRYDERERFDVSRLAQWEIVFEHADCLGLFLHFKTQETENQGLLDGGALGLWRKLYYRELIARFGHHPALNWNMGEENGDWAENPPTPPQNTQERLAMARYFHDHDPYGHPIVVHNGVPFDDLLTPASKYTGISLQCGIRDGHRRTLEWLEKSEAAGIMWTVCHDEQNPADHGVLPDEEAADGHAAARIGTLWGNLMAGGAGVEYYFGYKHPHSDLTCQDFRSRDRLWDQGRHALEFFFSNRIPFWEMRCEDGLISEGKGYCLCKPGSVYVIFITEGGGAGLDLEGVPGRFEARWYDPRRGEFFGEPFHFEGNGIAELGTPPREPDTDWAILITRTS